VAGATLPLGFIHDDLVLLAAAVWDASFRGSVRVWVDGAGRVFAHYGANQPPVEREWLVGEFAAGTPKDEIEVELRSALARRVRGGLL
jgi:hypothetical protein